MADGIDWSLAQTPNFAQAALSGYQAGQAIGRQRRFDAALGGLDLSRPETVMPLVAADPERGTPILGAALKIADAKRESDAHAAFGDAVAAMYGQPALTGGRSAPSTGGAALTGNLPGPASTPSPTPTSPGTIPTNDPTSSPLPGVSPTSDPTSAPSAAPGGANGDIVVTARVPPSVDPRQEAMVRLAYKDPDAFKQLVATSSTLDEARVKHIVDGQDALATAAMVARKLPYEQRSARIQAMKPWLLQHYVTEAQIDGFDPTDNNLDDLHDQALGVKGVMDQANKDRDFQMDQSRLAETQRHDRADEGTAAANAATSRGQLGVAQGRLSLAKTVAGTSGVTSASTPDLLAIARGQKGAPKPSASDIFAIAGDR